MCKYVHKFVLGDTTMTIDFATRKIINWTYYVNYEMLLFKG
jgi:hypothetical protein